MEPSEGELLETRIASKEKPSVWGSCQPSLTHVLGADTNWALGVAIVYQGIWDKSEHNHVIGSLHLGQSCVGR